MEIPRPASGEPPNDLADCRLTAEQQEQIAAVIAAQNKAIEAAMKRLCIRSISLTAKPLRETGQGGTNPEDNDQPEATTA